MQIIHFKKFSLPAAVSTGALKVHKLLNMPSDSISDGVIFQIFLGGPPLVLACFACLCALHTMSVNVLTSSTSTMMTGLVVPPFEKSRSAPDLHINNNQCTTLCGWIKGKSRDTNVMYQ